MSRNSDLNNSLLKKIQALSTDVEILDSELSQKKVKSDFSIEVIDILKSIVSESNEADLDTLEASVARLNELTNYVQQAKLGKREQSTLISSITTVKKFVSKKVSEKNSILKMASSITSNLSQSAGGMIENVVGAAFGNDPLINFATKALTKSGGFLKNALSAAIQNRKGKKDLKNTKIKSDASSLLGKAIKSTISPISPTSGGFSIPSAQIEDEYNEESSSSIVSILQTISTDVKNLLAISTTIPEINSNLLSTKTVVESLLYQSEKTSSMLKDFLEDLSFQNIENEREKRNRLFDKITGGNNVNKNNSNSDGDDIGIVDVAAGTLAAAFVKKIGKSAISGVLKISRFLISRAALQGLMTTVLGYLGAVATASTLVTILGSVVAVAGFGAIAYAVAKYFDDKDDLIEGPKYLESFLNKLSIEDRKKFEASGYSEKPSTTTADEWEEFNKTMKEQGKVQQSKNKAAIAENKAREEREQEDLNANRPPRMFLEMSEDQSTFTSIRENQRGYNRAQDTNKFSDAVNSKVEEFKSKGITPNKDVLWNMMQLGEVPNANVKESKLRSAKDKLTLDSSDAMSVDTMVNAIAQAETEGYGGDIWDESRFIRTEAGSNSSAYGPLQITYSRAQADLDRGLFATNPDLEDWVKNKFIPQGKKMINSNYSDPTFGAGGKGTLSGAEDREMYKQMSRMMLGDTLQQYNGDVIQTAGDWRFGAGKRQQLQSEDPRYARVVSRVASMSSIAALEKNTSKQVAEMSTKQAVESKSSPIIVNNVDASTHTAMAAPTATPTPTRAPGGCPPPDTRGTSSVAACK